MLARLQQASTLGLLIAALAWAIAFMHAGRVGWALTGALLIMLVYAAVLAVEFILLRLIKDSTAAVPRPSPTELFVAWCGETLAAPQVFCWRQPFRSRRIPDHLPANGQRRRGLLLVHGFVCNRGLWNRWLERLLAADVPFVAVNLEPVFGSIDDYVRIIEAAMQKLERSTGLAPVLVGHSMGGLAIRRWWVDQRGNNRVHHVITIGTPHQGTWLARFGISPNAKQMRRNSVWLQALARREPAAREARFTCFYGRCDNIVFPPSTATLAGADNRHLAGVAHVCMADRPEPYAEALKYLEPDAAR